MNLHTLPAPLRRFLFPKLDRYLCLRLILLGAGAWLFFSQLCIPAWVNGDSMMPTYSTGDLLFCWTPAFRSQPPQPGDVVMISYVGHKVMYLKRVVAVAGQTVEFRDGHLLVDGVPQTEPWVAGQRCNWNSQPLTVPQNCVFVVGDNRSMPMAQHLHGVVERKEIVGKPLQLGH